LVSYPEEKRNLLKVKMEDENAAKEMKMPPKK